jgi:hypothetical protein
VAKLPEDSGFPAFVAQRIEHLTTDQKVGGSSPSKRTESCYLVRLRISWAPQPNCLLYLLPEKEPTDVILWESIPVINKSVVY